MRNLFRIDSAEGYRYPLIERMDALSFLTNDIHSRLIGKNWQGLSGLYWGGEDAKKMPDVKPLYFPGILVVNQKVAVLLRDSAPGAYEFLPVVGLGSDWFVLNCLRAPRAIDPDKSTVVRSLNSKILLPHHLVIKGRPSQNIFSVEEMNGPLLFCDSSVCDLFSENEVAGVKFTEIGCFSSD